MTLPLLETLRLAAADQAAAESDFRRASQQRLAALVIDRERSFRRYHLLQAMAAAAVATPEPEAGVTAQLDAITRLTGWSPEQAGYDDMPARLGQLAGLLQRYVQAASADAPLLEAELRQALAAFEAWYRAQFGADFFDLMATESPSFQPVVDF